MTSGMSSVQTVLPAPAGYHVDFLNPARTAVAQTYWAAGVGNFFAVAFLAQKLYTKIYLDRRFQWDDGMLGTSNSPQFVGPSTDNCTYSLAHRSVGKTNPT